MPLNIKPAGATPAQQGPPAKYVPARMSPSMSGNAAPIAGVAAEKVAQAAAAAAANDEAADEGGGQADEGEGEEGRAQAPNIAWRLGIVAKKDAEARKRIDAAKAAEARVKDLEAAIAKREQALKAEEDKRASWRRDPRALLREHGFVPEAALEFLINDGKLTPEQQLAATVDQRLEAQARATEERLQKLQLEQEQKEADRLKKEEEEQQAQLSDQEELAVQELQADISDIVAGDAKAFVLVKKAGPRGVSAIYQRIKQLSDKQLEETGRRPPITTKMLERAAQEIEKEARAELQEAASDPELAAAIGISPQKAQPKKQNTLTNRMQQAPVQKEAAQEESAAEKRERVKRELDAIFKRTAAGR